MIGTLMAKKAITGAFDAMHRHDLPQFISGWRDDGAFVYPGDIPESGTIQGKAAVEAWFGCFLEQFPEVKFEIQDICARNAFDLVGNNVIAVHWNLKLTNREERAGENSGVSVVTIQGARLLW